MGTKTTKALQNHFTENNLDITEFIKQFNWWKGRGASGEYDSYLFGKDSAYVRPAVDGKEYTLMHVHLVPQSDLKQLEHWKNAYKNRRRKVSDRVLIYVNDSSGDYLLIYILPEFDAHRIAAMKTKSDKETMEGFAEAASAFIYDGAIIV